MVVRHFICVIASLRRFAAGSPQVRRRFAAGSLNIHALIYFRACFKSAASPRTFSQRGFPFPYPRIPASPAFALDITGDTVTTDLTVKGGSITLNNNNNTVTSGSSNGTSNTAVGYGALYDNTTGWSNTATGWNAMRDNTVGQRNTSLGSQAFRYQITGSHNVVLGWFAGNDLESGADLTAADESVFIGAATRAKTNGNQNSIVIGYNAIGDGSNTTVIGNSATVSTRLEGETKVEALRISGQVILEQPQGDISMGDYQ